MKTILAIIILAMSLSVGAQIRGGRIGVNTVTGKVNTTYESVYQTKNVDYTFGYPPAPEHSLSIARDTVWHGEPTSAYPVNQRELWYNYLQYIRHCRQVSKDPLKINPTEQGFYSWLFSEAKRGQRYILDRYSRIELFDLCTVRKRAFWADGNLDAYFSAGNIQVILANYSNSYTLRISGDTLWITAGGNRYWLLLDK